jgi:type IV secretory pathway TrbD component
MTEEQIVKIIIIVLANWVIQGLCIWVLLKKASEK